LFVCGQLSPGNSKSYLIVFLFLSSFQIKWKYFKFNTGWGTRIAGDTAELNAQRFLKAKRDYENKFFKNRGQRKNYYILLTQSMRYLHLTLYFPMHLERASAAWKYVRQTTPYPLSNSFGIVWQVLIATWNRNLIEL